MTPSALASERRTVVGLDLSPTAIKAAEDRLRALPPELSPPAGSAQFLCGSFFDLPSDAASQFSLVYDYTFLCALDPSIREQWARKMADLVAPGGLLVTLVFPICEKEGGPPFKVSLELYRQLLEPVGFECRELDLLPPELSHPGRDGSGAFGAFSGKGLWTRK